jgi:hypothetical protein
VAGARGDCRAGGCPLPLAGFDLELVLLEVAALVTADTAHHSVAD